MIPSGSAAVKIGVGPAETESRMIWPLERAMRSLR